MFDTRGGEVTSRTRKPHLVVSGFDPRSARNLKDGFRLLFWMGVVEFIPGIHDTGKNPRVKL